MEIPFFIKSMLPGDAVAQLEKLDLQELADAAKAAMQRMERAEALVLGMASELAALRTEVTGLRGQLNVSGILQPQQEQSNGGA